MVPSGEGVRKTAPMPIPRPTLVPIRPALQPWSLLFYLVLVTYYHWVVRLWTQVQRRFLSAYLLLVIFPCPLSVDSVCSLDLNNSHKATPSSSSSSHNFKTICVHTSTFSTCTRSTKLLQARLFWCCKSWNSFARPHSIPEVSTNLNRVQNSDTFHTNIVGSLSLVVKTISRQVHPMSKFSLTTGRVASRSFDRAPGIYVHT